MYKHTKFLASTITPNPIEVSHWIDLNEDTTGGVIKTFDGKQWNKITSDGTVDGGEQVKIKVFSYDDFIEKLDFQENKIHIKESFLSEYYKYWDEGYITFLSLDRLFSKQPIYITSSSYSAHKVNNLIMFIPNNGVFDRTSSSKILPFFEIDFDNGLVIDDSKFLTYTGIVSLEENNNCTINGNPVNDIRLNDLYISQAFGNIIKWSNQVRNALIDNVPELSDNIPILDVTAKINQSTTTE